MTRVLRQVQESPLRQGPDERIAYAFTWTAVGTPSSAGFCYVYDKMTNTDVSTTCLSGSPSLTGDVVTSPLVISLTAGNEYWLVSKVVIGGNTVSSVLEIEVDRR